MTDNPPHRWRRLWLLPPIIIGIAVIALMASKRQPPASNPAVEQARSVRVLSVQPTTLVPLAEGYGNVLPAQQWSAVAQVSGRVVQMHPRLRNGEIIAAGELLLQIDPVDYQLQLSQAQAALSELDTQQENTRASLVIEQRALQLAEREYQRLKRLIGKGTASQADVDNAERSLLAARQTVQNLNNTLALIPSQRQQLQAQLQQSERNLANTEIRAPFNLRVSELAVEDAQFVATGQRLFAGDAVDRVEVTAQFPMSALRNLFIGRPGQIGGVADLNRQIKQIADFQPEISLDMGGHIARWQAEFVRFSDSVDPKTRTIGVVVAVDDPLGKIRIGDRPPLSKGMFVQVRLRGHEQTGRLLVPRSALHDGQLYLVDGDNRLRIRPARILFQQGELAVLAGGIEPGERVVLSNLIPAVEGMLLAPQDDPAAARALAEAAAGQRP